MWTPRLQTSEQRAIQIRIRTGVLLGDLGIPKDPRGIVVFSHSSGTSRFSPRNRALAQGLQQARLATLLCELFTHEEDTLDRKTMALRFDIDLLTARLTRITDWLLDRRFVPHRRVGYFGVSTGCAAALAVAAFRPDQIAAVVCRGGRPDLAGQVLFRVAAPTLFVIGSEDPEGLRYGHAAYEAMHCDRKIELVEGATHLFEEAGAIEHLRDAATAWFDTHLAGPPAV